MVLLNLNLNFRFSKRYFKSPIGPKNRLRILKSKIRHYQPAVITFQEATDILILTQLKRALKGYQFVYSGWLKINGGVVTLYDPVRWKLLDKHFTAFTKQGKVFSKQLSDRILRKGILSCVFQNLKTSRKLLLVNVHLTANYGQKLAEEEREILKIQLEEIKKIIKKHKLRREVIAGDFNADFSSQRIQRWLKQIEFAPAFGIDGCTVCPTKNPLCYRDRQKDYQIDNVLCHGCRQIKGRLIFNKKGEFISDHYGQLVEMEL